MTAALRAAAITTATAVMVAVPVTAQASEWHRGYYNNFFKSFLKCVSRGEGAIGNRTHDQVINGAISYVCYKAPGKRRYSMDILFDFDDGGGGGGGGSWKMRS